MTSFDNFFAGVLEVFTILSMSGWNELMYSLEEAETPWAVPVYFALVVAVRLVWSVVTHALLQR